MAFAFGGIVGVVVFLLFLLFLSFRTTENLPTESSSGNVLDKENSGEPVFSGAPDKPLLERTIKPFLRKISGKEFGWDEIMQEFLNDAGCPGGLTSREFYGLENLSRAFFTSVMAAFGTALKLEVYQTVILAIIGTFIGDDLPRRRLRSIIANRKKIIKRQFPEVFEILTAEAEAGAGVDVACNKVSEQIVGPISDEFTRTLQEIRRGKNRGEAFQDMAIRIDHPGLSLLISTMMKVERTGGSLCNALRIQAENILAKNPPPTEEAMPIAMAHMEEVIHMRLLDDPPPGLLSGSGMEKKHAILRERIFPLMDASAERLKIFLPNREKEILVQELINSILGFGRIQKLLDDKEISCIMVNGHSQVFFEKQGRLVLSDIAFWDNHHIMEIVERFLHPLGQEINVSAPYAASHLPDGSPVHVVIPPLCLNGPSFIIQRSGAKHRILDLPASSVPQKNSDIETKPFSELIKSGTLSEAMAIFLAVCVKTGLNIVVSGEPEAEPALTLNRLGHLVSDEERIITCEETAGQKVAKPHVMRLVACHSIPEPPQRGNDRNNDVSAVHREGKSMSNPAFGESSGKKIVSMSQLVRIAIDLEPDRLIIGECCKEELPNIFQAISTAHVPFLTACRSSGPADTLQHLEVLFQTKKANGTVQNTRKQIAAAVNLIVHQARFPDGSTRLTHITEIPEVSDGEIMLNDIFRFEPTKPGSGNGIHRATGIQSSFLSRFQTRGIALPANLFNIRNNG